MRTNIRTLIKSLLEIDVNTDDLNEIRTNPAAYVASAEDTHKLENLLLLLALMKLQTGGQHDT